MYTNQIALISYNPKSNVTINIAFKIKYAIHHAAIVYRISTGNEKSIGNR